MPPKQKEDLEVRLGIDSQDVFELEAAAVHRGGQVGEYLDKRLPAAQRTGPKTLKVLKTLGKPADVAFMLNDVRRLATSEDARQNAREHARALSQETNPVVKHIRAQLDPVDTIYGTVEALKSLHQAKKSAAASAAALHKEQAVRQRMEKLLHKSATPEQRKIMLKRLRREATPKTVWGFGRPEGKPKAGERSFQFADGRHEIVKVR